MATASNTSDADTTASQSFARFCAGLDYEALPRVAVDRVKHFFIDYIGIALHASTLDSSQPLRKLAAERPIPGGATLLARSDLVNAHWAAFANGMAAHSMELDDTYLPGSIHNESFVFSPVSRWRKNAISAASGSLPPSSLDLKSPAVSPPLCSRQRRMRAASIPPAPRARSAPPPRRAPCSGWTPSN